MHAVLPDSTFGRQAGAEPTALAAAAAAAGSRRGIMVMEIVFNSAQGFKASGREESAMKARNSIRSLKRRPGSVVVRRRGKVFVINRAHPRWKARQG
jgi:large subunit ribosomal protein L36